MSPVVSTNGLTSVDHVYPSTQGSHLPLRPREPECRYFTNTGSCKYGSDCKYNHPRENIVKTDASSFGPFGLPLRPVSYTSTTKTGLLNYTFELRSDALVC